MSWEGQEGVGPASDRSRPLTVRGCGSARPFHLMPAEDEDPLRAPDGLLAVVVSGWRGDPGGEDGPLLALADPVALGAPAATCEDVPVRLAGCLWAGELGLQRVVDGEVAEVERLRDAHLLGRHLLASFVRRPGEAPSPGAQVVDVVVHAVGIARAEPLEKDPVPRPFEPEVLVAVAVDLAAATGTVVKRGEEPEPRHDGPPDSGCARR